MTFDEIVEQEHAVNALRQSVISKRVAHAYLFSGTRGTGKTSIAKVFSRAINCLSPNNGNPCNQCSICRGILDGSLLDVIEMDAASNNSVDNIRRICDEVLFMPAQAKYKVYIVDEVHMLSTGAFNALLKTLEEPPEHAIFILATTEPHRIPATIISRCQRYDFRRIPNDSIVGRLRSISDDSGILIEDQALQLIATLSDGAMRDAISLLDQVGTGTAVTITESDIFKMIGMVDRTVFFDMARFILTSNVFSVLTLCNRIIMDGRDILRFTLDLAHYFRDLTVISLSADPQELVSATDEEISRMRSLCKTTNVSQLLSVIKRLSSLSSELKWSPDMKTSFETSLIALASASVPEPAIFPRQSSGDSKILEPSVPTESSPQVDIQHAEPPVSIAPSIAIRSSASDQRPDPSEDLTPPPAETEMHQDSLDEPPTSSFTDESHIDSPLPNLKRAFEPAPRSKGESTNLSKLIHKPLVRSANIPLPPDIDDSDFQTSLSDYSTVADTSVSPATNRAVSNSEAVTSDPADLQSQWPIALSALQSARYGDALRFRNARVHADGSTLAIVFPTNMQTYINDLEQKGGYESLKALILSHFSGFSDLSLSVTKDDPDPPSDRPSQPQWVQQMLDFADNNGIVIEEIVD